MRAPAIRCDGWNHNTHYHGRLLQAVPAPCRRALDVGCGTGAFARQLASRAVEVVAIDRDPAVLRRAHQASAGMPNLRFVEADFLAWPIDGSYDFVSMIASLHHLPFDEAVSKAAAALAPGGVLAVLGLDRPRSRIDAVIHAAAAYPVSSWYRLTRNTAPVEATIRDPEMTLQAIRHRARSLLPGATLQRHVLWRYSLIWIKRAEEA